MVIKWASWAVWIWIAILGTLFANEMYALLGGNAKDMPLTQLTVKYSPWYVTLPFIGWLFIHFAIRYFNPAYVTGLVKK